MWPLKKAHLPRSATAFFTPVYAWYARVKKPPPHLALVCIAFFSSVSHRRETNNYIIHGVGIGK